MPIFRSGAGQAPAWCKLERFEFVSVARGQSATVEREGAKEELIACNGNALVAFGDVECVLMQGGKLDLNGPSVQRYSIAPYGGDVRVCRMVGRWQSITSSGIFTSATATPPTHDTPYSYEKTTGFDNHYHDCDEYWIVLDGEATVASEGRLYDVGPGDCVATGMGWHHDVLQVKGDVPMRGIWFEGTLAGARRMGHLWEPKHGQAVPEADRV